MKIVFKLIRRLVITFSIIYTLDLILESASIFIPINISTLTVGTILGPFGIISLIIISILIK